MEKVKLSHRYIARITIEFTTPFLIGAGRSGDFTDSIFVSDVNSLPAIPGSSLAGILRTEYEKLYTKQEAEDIFGYQNGSEGKGSRLIISWGCIHNGSDMPVEAILLGAKDAVLANAEAATIRDHVKLTHRGVADTANTAKFDEQPVSAGHRFTFELELRGDQNDSVNWKNLLGIFQGGSLRIGGKSRRGFGAFKVEKCLQKDFDLTKPEDFNAYKKHPASLAAKTELAGMDIDNSQLKPEFDLKLKPKGYWMFGGGFDDETGADSASVRDSMIKWKDKKGTVKRGVLIIPGSSIKGALSHRTAFHYNCLNGFFVGDKEAKAGEENTAVKELFGCAKNTPEKKDGKKGRVIIDDIYLEKEPQKQLIHHVGIDRYTGGARDGVLFSEKALWKCDSINIKIYVKDFKLFDEKIQNAFKKAVDDLEKGRLPLGAGSGRGNGYFEKEEVGV